MTAPHPAHPALALKQVAILTLLAVLLSFTGCADGSVQKMQPGPPLEQPPVLDAARARDTINSYRATKGLRPLVLDARLTQAATVQAEDLARRDTLDHQGADGSSISDRIARTGYRLSLAAENIAAGQRDWTEVLEGWKSSRAHDRNLLLADATQMGIAAAFSRDTKFRSFWVLVLAAPER